MVTLKFIYFKNLIIMNELQTVFLQFIKKVSQHIKAHFFYQTECYYIND